VTRRLADIADLPVEDSEQLRAYTRKVDGHIQDLITEIECRQHELNGLIAGLLVYAKSKGYGDGKQHGLKAARVTLPMLKCAMALRLARHWIRLVYPKFESILAVELRELRREKYGKDAPKPRRLEVV
jgi:hypothetical protein